MNKKTLLILLITPIVFLITHAIAYLFHEYSHSFVAWALGYKQNPLALNYGDASWQNILFLYQIDENVAYSTFSATHPWAAAFIAFSGSGIGNFVLLLISIFALHQKNHCFLYYYFFLWLAVMNIGNFIDYVPIRTFSNKGGDVYGIISYLHISPWWLMVIFGYPILYSVWYFYSKLLPQTYTLLKLNLIQQIMLLFLVTYTLCRFFGSSGLHDHGEISHVISLLFLYTMPIVIVACWPQREWVVNARII